MKDKTLLFYVTVGGNKIPVYEIPELRDDEDSLLDGRWRPVENEIWVRAALPRERFLVTLLHEAFHAAEHEFKIDVEHQAVYVLSSIAGQVVKDTEGLI